MLLWETWVLSQKMRIRPSDLVAEDDPYVAFCLDRAVATFGMALENELESVEETGKKGEAKRQRILAKWVPEQGKASAKRFRNPEE